MRTDLTPNRVSGERRSIAEKSKYWHGNSHLSINTLLIMNPPHKQFNWELITSPPALFLFPFKQLLRQLDNCLFHRSEYQVLPKHLQSPQIAQSIGSLFSRVASRELRDPLRERRHIGTQDFAKCLVG